MKQPTAAFTGSTYWNLGDDIVREGARNIVARAFGLRSSRHLSCHFFPFNLSRNNLSPLGENNNFIDISKPPPHLDLIVVPGLACGYELTDFHRWLREHGLTKKTVYIGGMWENAYAARHSALDTVAHANLRESPLIVSRTEKVPGHVTAWRNIHTLPCPSLLTVEESHIELPPRRAYVAVSIQLSEQQGGIVNHRVTGEVHDKSVALFRELGRQAAGSGIKRVIVCHHKTELEFWRNKHDNVFFSPWAHDYRAVYQGCSGVLSSRLHACFYANALGRLAYCTNDCERVEHAMKENPFTLPADNFSPASLVSRAHDSDQITDTAHSIRKFREDLNTRYQKLLIPTINDLRK